MVRHHIINQGVVANDMGTISCTRTQSAGPQVRAESGLNIFLCAACFILLCPKEERLMRIGRGAGLG